MLRYGISELNYLKLIRESKSPDFTGCRRTMRLAILSDSAPQYLTPLFKALLCKNGIRPEVYEAEYDTVELEIVAEGRVLSWMIVSLTLVLSLPTVSLNLT